VRRIIWREEILMPTTAAERLRVIELEQGSCVVVVGI
jgi:hypothetical protein